MCRISEERAVSAVGVEFTFFENANIWKFDNHSTFSFHASVRDLRVLSLSDQMFLTVAQLNWGFDSCDIGKYVKLMEASVPNITLDYTLLLVE